MNPLTEKEIKKMNNWLACIDQCNTSMSNAYLKKDTLESVILDIKNSIKEYDKIIRRKKKYRYYFENKIKEIEKDRTCYGCCINDCPVAKDFNNERCDKYDDGLPF